MSELKKLTRKELGQLLKEGPEWSTKELIDYCEVNRIEPYDFFEKNAVEIGGIVSDRPLYFGALIKLEDRYILYTFINRNLTMTEHIGVYKTAKRVVKQWAKKYGEVWSYIENDMPLQQKWILKMGFQKEKVDEKFMISKLKKEDCYV